VTLRIGTALPLLQTGGLSGIVELLTVELLVGAGWDGRPVPRLAESWQELPDARGVRLKLRPGVRFHTGELVTAPEVVRLLKAEIAVTRAQGVSGSEIIERIEPDGDDAIVIRYTKPDAFFLTDLNLYNISDQKDAQLRTGPYRIVAEKPVVQLAAFDGYYQGRPAIDRVEIAAYATPRAAWTAMMRGEVNFLHEVSRDAVEFVEAESEVKTYPLLRPYYVALVFNTAHAALGKRDVRVALSEAVDRQAVVDVGMWGHGRAADGPLWPYHWAYSSAQRTYAFNPDAARLRLDSAGFKRADRRDAKLMDSRFRFTCLLPNNDIRFERIALILQRQLAEIGVDMDFEALTTRSMVERLGTGRFDAFLFEMTSGRTLSWIYRFWHSPAPGAPPLFLSGYRGADEPLDRLRNSRSDHEVRVAVADVQRALYEDPPALFLAWPRETRAIDTTFSMPYEPDQDVLGTVWRGRPAGQVVRAAR
jgi:peptide/nickel transport system substrate-binding protein